MKKVPIDDCVVIPYGWEAVCVRPPMRGEYYFDGSNCTECRGDFWESPLLIVRKAHQWPDWLKPGWVACNAEGEPAWFECKPSPHGGFWLANKGHFCRQIGPATTLLLPEYDDWREACWEVT